MFCEYPPKLDLFYDSLHPDLWFLKEEVIGLWVDKMDNFIS